MSTARGEIRGWHVMTALLAFFGVVIAVNAAFIVFAVRTFPGEDVRRSYLQGLRFNDTLEERRTQSELGWQAGAVLEEGEAGVILEVTLRERDGAPLTGANLSGNLQWPTDAHLDRTLVFERAGAGRYISHLDDLSAGRWRLRARAQRDDGALDLESELTWRSR
jgi:nitrogen fixation protein FixH